MYNLDMTKLEDVVSLAKRRGFIYPGSEIYGGLKGFWDYGPLGVELKNNIKREWWKTNVYERDDVVGIDAAIIMNPKVWEASGHVKAFTDPLFECKYCHKRFRADHFEEASKEFLTRAPKTKTGKVAQSEKFRGWLCDVKKRPHKNDDLIGPRLFNLLTEVYLGVTEPKQKAYLRGEVTQGVFVNFKNVVDSSRMKIPFGIAQIGKAFRNEITPGNLTYRSREFEQMELEYFIKPEEAEGVRIFNQFKKDRLNWYVNLGMTKKNLRFREHEEDEKAHYARSAEDIEYKAPFGWSEFEGIHHRGDWDLSQHNLTYKDPNGKDEFTPWVIETSGGVDRAALFFLIDAYHKDKDRIVLKLHPKLAPFKVAVFPLLANKDSLVKKAKEIYSKLLKRFPVSWDARGNIGKRYFAQDEIGTPWCITIDFDTLEKDTVTVRDRDTTKQERISVDKLGGYLQNKLS